MQYVFLIAIVFFVLGFNLKRPISFTPIPTYSSKEDKYYEYSKNLKSTSDQIIEDLRVEREIERAAWEMFKDWSNAPMIKLSDGQEFKNFIVIVPPFIGIYSISDEKTSKYKDVDTTKLILKRFQELKNEYESGTYKF